MTIFHKIVEKKIPANIIYEDEDVIAILDAFPATYGHTLVLPKKPSKTILEMTQEDFKILMEKTQKLAKEITNLLDAKGCNILINSNPEAGQTVPYTHVHIVPRYDTKYQIYNTEKEVENVDFRSLLEKLKIDKI